MIRPDPDRRKRVAVHPPAPPRAPLCRAQAGHVLLELPIEAPAVTDERGRPPTDGALRDAAAAYARAIPARPGRSVLAVTQPAVLRVTFTFRGGRRALGPLGDRTSWHADLPPLAEHVGLLVAVLARRGYLVHPAEVACLVLAKRCGPTAGVRVYLRTLADAEDSGQEFPWPPDAAPGEVRLLDLAAPASIDVGERPLPFAGKSDPHPAPPEKRARKSEGKKEVGRGAEDPQNR